MTITNPMLSRASLAAVVAGILQLVGVAADSPGTYTTPEASGPDYQIQGEYAGTAEREKLGAQVIALGTGRFQAVFFRGGLPGAGGDAKTRVEAESRTEAGVTRFDGAGWSAEIERGRLVGRTDKDAFFRLRKVNRKSPTLGAKPPSGATVLFEGTGVEAWNGGKMTEDHLLMAGTGTKRGFGDYRLHAEFRLPFMPAARGQGRANSGVYLQDRYEVQILDSFGLKGLDNECAGLYRQKAPDVNMCLPPLVWQTYDIDFRAARFDSTGNRMVKAVVTIRQNGVVVHDHVKLDGPTPGGKPESAESGGISLQNHGNPVVFRNVWLQEGQAE
jgi:hypothetical protein